MNLDITYYINKFVAHDIDVQLTVDKDQAIVDIHDLRKNRIGITRTYGFSLLEALKEMDNLLFSEKESGTV